MLMCPAETVVLRCQVMEPVFLIVMSWSPEATEIDDGVFATNLPSTSMAAPGGVDVISCSASAATVYRGCSIRRGIGRLKFCFIQPGVPVDISGEVVPFGIVMSLSCMKRNSVQPGKRQFRLRPWLRSWRPHGFRLSHL